MCRGLTVFSDEGNVFRKALGVKGNLLGLIPGRQVRLPLLLACMCMPGHLHTCASYSNRGRVVQLSQTFVFDKTGQVALVFNSQMDPERHIKEAMAVIKTL